jgi:hypothetical protein
MTHFHTSADLNAPSPPQSRPNIRLERAYLSLLSLCTSKRSRYQGSLSWVFFKSKKQQPKLRLLRLNFGPHSDPWATGTLTGICNLGQKLVAHWHITQWIHMEDMKWFSSYWIGVVTRNAINRFWATLPNISQLQSKTRHGLTQMGCQKLVFKFRRNSGRSFCSVPDIRVFWPGMFWLRFRCSDSF